MVATPDLGSGAERRGGSSPFIRTSTEQISLLGFRLIKELGQLVAVWQTCLCSVRCSVVVLLRNRKPCANSQKVNNFPFSLFAQCLQLRCPPPLQLSHARSAQTCCDRSSPEMWKEILGVLTVIARSVATWQAPSYHLLWRPLTAL